MLRRTISRKGRNFIARWEGFPARQPYNDIAGHCTAGYGHLIHHGPCTTADVVRWNDITKDHALRLLKRDLTGYVAGVKALIDQPMTQRELDMLTSFAYNMGLGALEGSTLRRRINQGENVERVIVQEFPRWVKAGNPPVTVQGLVNRRWAEIRVVRGGRYR